MSTDVPAPLKASEDLKKSTKAELKFFKRTGEGQIEVNARTSEHIAEFLRRLFSDEGLKEFIALRNEAKVLGKPLQVKHSFNGMGDGTQLDEDATPASFVRNLVVNQIVDTGVDLKTVREEIEKSGYSNKRDPITDAEKLVRALNNGSLLLKEAFERMPAFEQALTASRVKSDGSSMGKSAAS
ncbi:MAG: hypothetical protein EBR02_07370 [Alphaproteobacteria bacterium]|nr:hypothetical protein [Alphaproteobacteria bacterium]